MFIAAKPIDWQVPWCPGSGGHTKSENIPGSLYSQAINEVASGNYTLAETGFKQVIAEFPENKYALTSLKELFALNRAIYNLDYSSLKTYCDSLALNPGDSLLGKTAEWFSIRCNIENENFQQAVNSLDSILEDPGTYADSVFALIDLCEVLTEIIDTSGLKLSLATLNPQIIPDSYHQFKEKRKDWIDLLLKSDDTNGQQETLPIQSKSDYSKPCMITSIHPNPAQEQLTIEYSVNRKGKVNISILSISGQIVNSWDKNILDQGEYILTFNVANYPSGIYFISLYYENCNIDNIKLIR